MGGKETDDSKRKEIYNTQNTEVDKAEGSGKEWFKSIIKSYGSGEKWFKSIIKSYKQRINMYIGTVVY